MMDTSIQNFKSSDPSNFAQVFHLSPDELKEILPEVNQPFRKDSRQSLNREWPNIISQRLKELFDCVVKARGGTVKKPNSRKKSSPWFRGHLACIESSCNRYYTVIIRNRPSDAESVQVEVVSKGEIDHSAREQGFIVRRQIRGKIRQRKLEEKSALRDRISANRVAGKCLKLTHKRVSLMRQLCRLGLPTGNCRDHSQLINENHTSWNEDHRAAEAIECLEPSDIIEQTHPSGETFRDDEVLHSQETFHSRCARFNSAATSSNSIQCQSSLTQQLPGPSKAFTRVVDIPLPLHSNPVPMASRTEAPPFRPERKEWRGRVHLLSTPPCTEEVERAQLETERLKKQYYQLKIYKTMMEIREKERNISSEPIEHDLSPKTIIPLHYSKSAELGSTPSNRFFDSSQGTIGSRSSPVQSYSPKRIPKAGYIVNVVNFSSSSFCQSKT